MESNQTQSINCQLRFGFEAEVLLTWRGEESKRPPSMKKTAEYIEKNYQSELKVKVYSSLVGGEDEEDEEDPTYATWSLAEDDTIKKSAPGQVPLEIISPIFQHADVEGWHTHTKNLWDFVGMGFQIAVNDSCSTHIHVSPNGDWELEQVKRIACAALYFEGAFEFLLPESRRQNLYAKSNRVDNEQFKGLTVDQCIDAILGCEDIGKVAQKMCNGERSFGWNLKSFDGLGAKTVEFRRWPGSEDFDSLYDRVAFILSFVYAAIQYGKDKLKGFEKNVGGLCKFIFQGAALGPIKYGSLLEILDRVVDGKDHKGYQEPVPFKLKGTQVATAPGGQSKLTK